MSEVTLISKFTGNQLPNVSETAVGQGVVVVGPTSIENFEKIHLRAGQIVEASGHPEADKLLVMKVDVGEEQPRSIVAGIASRFKPEELINQKVTVVANLKPSNMRCPFRRHVDGCRRRKTTVFGHCWS